MSSIIRIIKTTIISISLLLAFSVNAHADSTVSKFILPDQFKTSVVEDLNGKIIYLDFWASWCAPCRESFPWMNMLHKKYADRGLVVIAVNLDENQQDAQQFLKELPAEFQVIYDPEGELAEIYNVQGMPSSYLFNRNGKLVSTHIGFKNRDADVLQTSITSLLN